MPDLKPHHLTLMAFHPLGTARADARPDHGVVDADLKLHDAEGVYVGYRYHRTFGRAPAYAFGHGMSYTTFRYGGLRLAGTPNGPADSLTATVTVTNTGRAAGREAAQLYVSAPKGTLDKPERELRGFAKTGLLQPGASETLTFRLGAADLASFDPATIPTIRLSPTPAAGVPPGG